MKTRIVTLAAILGMATPILAEAGGVGYYNQGWGAVHPSSFYGGGSLGIANQGTFEDGTTPTGKLFAGARINHILGAEIGYVKLGEAESTTLDGRNDADIKSDTSALYAAAVGYLPVARNMEVMGKVGAVRWSQDNSKSVGLIDTHTTSSDSGVSPLIGLGAQYRISQNMQVRGEWERALKAGTENSDYETDIDLLTVGVSFNSL